MNEITLAPRDFDLERANLLPKADVIYRFRYCDLIARDDSKLTLELSGNDLEIQKRTRRQRKQRKKRCICLNIVIIGKTPSGAPGSKYAGGKWKTQRAFLDLLDSALQYLLGCVDEYCMHLVERNVGGKAWDKYFAKDIDGKTLEIIDADQKEAFVKAIKESTPALKDPCCWLFWNRIVDDGLAGMRPGTTPVNVEKIPGTKTYKATSDGYSFISDKAEDFQIAHEIVHQAGVTHSKDNLIPEDATGDPAVNKATPNNDRNKNDLMHPVSQKGAKLAPADCTKLREYTANHECCEENAPTVDEFFGQ